jgi:hypothetical protein
MGQYVVISWDSSQRQVFYDVVPAQSETQARNRVNRLRDDYAEVVDVKSATEFVELATAMRDSTPIESESVLRELEQAIPRRV